MKDASDTGASGPSQAASQTLETKSLVESLLFVADEPVRIDRLAAVLEVSAAEIESALSELSADYAGRGIRLQQKAQQVQMVTAPEAAEPIRRLLGLEQTDRLSQAALETLALVAYRQPVTRSQIEAVRGVNSDSVLRTLLSHGLIEEQGRLEQAGRPIIYGTTFGFLQQFGLTSLEQLPPLEDGEAQSDSAASATADAGSIGGALGRLPLRRPGQRHR